MSHPTNRDTRPAPHRASALDMGGITGLVAVLLLTAYFRSSQTMFWSDEIMGWFVVHAPNWHVLLQRWNAGIDSSGIWFYVLGRPWLAVFGATERSLRMFSAAGIAASAAIIWLTARRFYDLIPVASAVTFVYAVLQPLRWQLANGRTYGVFMLACAVVVYLILRGEERDADRPKPIFLVATFAAYCFLTGSHILGSMYAFLFLAVQIAMDVKSKRIRPLLYLAAAGSFAVYFFSRFNIAATTALGKPSFWTVKPALRQLLTMSILFGHRIAIGIAILFLVGLLHIRLREERLSVYALLLGFAVMDLFVFTFSRFGSTSIYVDRYLLPISFGAILLLGELFTQLRDADARWPIFRSALPFVFLLAGLVVFFVHRFQPDIYPQPNYTNRLLASLPPGVPIVNTDVGSFVETEFYHHGDGSQRMLFPVDWEVALDRGSFGGVSGFHEMDNFKMQGLYADDILPTPDILHAYAKFVVLTDPIANLWLRRRILSDSSFRASRLPNVPHGLEAWLVERTK